MNSQINFLDSPDLKWIFVSGKGGSGKTTIASAIAVALSQRGRSVLLASTDRSSNLSDIFRIELAHEPRLVPGFVNLYAADIMDDEPQTTTSIGQLLRIRGSEDFRKLVEVLNSTDEYCYDVIVFDMAPFGATSNLMHMPGIFFRAMQDESNDDQSDEEVYAAISPVFGSDSQAKMERIEAGLKVTMKRLTNKKESVFVCITQPSDIAINETERFLTYLSNDQFYPRFMIINQIIPIEAAECHQCTKRVMNQQKAMQALYEMYSDEIIIHQIPLFDHDINSVKDLDEIAILMEPLFTPNHGLASYLLDN